MKKRHDMQRCPNCDGVGHVWTGEDVTWCRLCDSNGFIPIYDDDFKPKVTGKGRIAKAYRSKSE